MEIEAYGDYDTMSANSIPIYGNWIGHPVEIVRKDDISHLVKGSPMQGCGDIKNAIKLLNVEAKASMEAWSLQEILLENGGQNRKVVQVASKEIRSMGTEASGEVKVEVSWGDKDGTKVNVGASGKVSDDKGNYVKAEIKQDNNGNGNAAVSVGVKKDK